MLGKVNNNLPQVQTEPEPDKIISEREYETIRGKLEYLIAAVKTGERVLFREMPA